VIEKLEIIEIDGTLGVIFPQDVLDLLNAGLGDELDVSIETGCVFIKRRAPQATETKS
jgi:antitoxin component of MazEF toxin-antitoxin module